MFKSANNQKKVGILLALILCFLAVPAFAAAPVISSIGPQPVLQNIFPNSGVTSIALNGLNFGPTRNGLLAGDLIKIYGSGFGPTRGTSYVKFGSVNVTTYVAWTNLISPEEIDCLIPAGLPAGSNPITVTVNGQTSNPMPFSMGPSTVKFGTTAVTTYDAWTNLISPEEIDCKVPAGLAPGTYPVTITVNGQVSNPKTFTVTATQPQPVFGTIAPDRGVPGMTLTNVSIVGTNTHFVNGMTTVSFGATGVTASNIYVIDSTHLICTVAIASSAAIGATNVVVTTSTGTVTETVTGVNMFIVKASGTPVLTSVTPNSGDQGLTLTGVKIAGANTHFGGTTTINMGADITVSNIVASDSTDLTCDITIGSSAAMGTRNVVVTTGTEIVTGRDMFTVNAFGAAYFSGINPNNGDQGATLTSVAISGVHTHFDGTTTVSFGSTDITVSNISVSDARYLTCNVAISASAAVGAKNVIVTTGSEVVIGNNAFTVNQSSTGGTAPVVTSVAPVAGPYGTAPFTTYVNIVGTKFGSTQGTSTVMTPSTAALNPVLWTDTRIVVQFPSQSQGRFSPGQLLGITVTVNGLQSNNDKTFTPIAGQMIDNYEDASMYNYFDSGSANGEADIPAPTRVTTQYYDGQYSIQAKYPGATGAQWGGFWGGTLKSATQTSLDLSSCNMFIFRMKGDGSDNAIRLDVLESGDAAKAEPFRSLDQYSLKDSSGLQEYKVPFSRLWRSEYTNSVKDDNIFSKSIKGYTFNYFGTNTNTAFNNVDFVAAVNWTGPIIDQIGPNAGPVGTLITITGSGFGNIPGSSMVKINGNPRQDVSWSDTKITVPVGGDSGPVTVTVGGQTSNGVPFTVTALQTGPIITTINPTSGGSGDQVTITGTDFGDDPLDPGNPNTSRSTASNHVVFGTHKVLAADVTSWSSKEIVVKVPKDDAGLALIDGIYPVQVTAKDVASNLVDFTIGTVITGPVSNISITRAADAVGSGVNLSWTCATGNVDIWTKTGAFDTNAGTWTKEFSNVSGTQQADPNQVGNGINKWYKIMAANSGLTATDLAQEVLGKFDLTLTEGFNLISTPLITSSNTIGGVIGSQLTGSFIPPLADKIYRFKSDKSGYEQAWLNNTDNIWYDADTGLQTTMTFDPDMGYWIELATGHASSNVSIVGQISNSGRGPISITTGFNLVGSTQPVSVSIENAGIASSGATASFIPPLACKIYSFKADKSGYEQAWLSSADNKWYDADTGLQSTMMLTCGKAYWIEELNSFSWSYPKQY
jgi:hypothetical protein